MAIYRIDSDEFLGNNKTLFEVVMLADGSGNIINSFAQSSNINLSAGLIDGYSHINKFGYMGTDQNGTATIWDNNAVTSLYPWPTTANTITVTSSSGTDAGKTVEVQGLDENYNAATEELTIAGSASNTSFIRVFRAIVTGNGVTNVGKISVNHEGTAIAAILAGNGQTLMSVYTIPAGKTGYLVKFQGSMDKQNVDVKHKLFARPYNGAFNIKGQWGIQGGNSVNYDYPVPLKFTEKTDIESRMTTGGNCGGGSIFDLVLVDNE